MLHYGNGEMIFLQILNIIDKKITTLSDCIIATPHKMKNGGIRITKLCAFPGESGSVWENVDALCNSMKTINDGEIECLGIDTNKWITAYIKQNYGDLTNREKKYNVIAEKFKSEIDTHFSTCKIEDLYGYNSGLFEFNFSRTDNPPIVIYSRSESEQIKVYIRVQDLKPAEDPSA